MFLRQSDFKSVSPLFTDLRTKKVKGAVLGLRDVYEGSITKTTGFSFA